MSKFISKEEAERQAKFATEQALFQLGKTTQSSETIKDNKLKIKQKLFEDYIPPKITDKIFTLSSNLKNTIRNIKDDQVYFALQSFLKYQILSGGKTYEECIKNNNVVNNGSLYLKARLWKTEFNNAEKTHQIYIRNYVTGKSSSNSFTFHLQKLDEEITSQYNYNIITLDKPLPIGNPIANELYIIDIQRDNIKLESIKKLLFVEYFLKSEISDLKKELKVKTDECDETNEISDGYIKEIEHNETILKSKETYINILHNQMNQTPFLTYGIISLLLAVNAFSMYAAMYGFEQLTIDTYDYILYPIYIVIHLSITSFTDVGICIFVFSTIHIFLQRV